MLTGPLSPRGPNEYQLPVKCWLYLAENWPPLSELRMILLGLFLQQRSYSTTRAAVERALLRLMNF